MHQFEIKATGVLCESDEVGTAGFLISQSWLNGILIQQRVLVIRLKLALIRPRAFWTGQAHQ